jgi:hypothetical protein
MSYNDYQMTFILSMTSNFAAAVNNSDPTLAAQEIENQFSSALPQIIAAANFPVNVTVAWGPYVVVEPDDITSAGVATATNTMVVFKYPSQSVAGVNEYVVAIAGTKAASVFDKMKEDMLGGKIAPWPYSSDSNNIKISQGTLNGVGLLLGLNSGNPIATYFSNLEDPNAIITVAGHSLGGALSPALALVLFGADTTYSAITAQAKKQTWTTRTYATAGPDVGNSDYVAYLKKTFKPEAEPAVKWQQFNCKIWNSIDIVPQVWSKGFESYIDNIYGTQLKTPLLIKSVLGYLYTAILTNNGFVNPYICSDPKRDGQFAGTFQTPLPANGPMIADDCSTNSACSATPQSVSDCEFVGQILYQHINAYFNEIGVSAFLTAVTAKSTPMSVCAIKQDLWKLVPVSEETVN